VDENTALHLIRRIVRGWLILASVVNPLQLNKASVIKNRHVVC